jgi:hypothetical protein
VVCAFIRFLGYQGDDETPSSVLHGGSRASVFCHAKRPGTNSRNLPTPTYKRKVLIPNKFRRVGSELRSPACTAFRGETVHKARRRNQCGWGRTRVASCCAALILLVAGPARRGADSGSATVATGRSDTGEYRKSDEHASDFGFEKGAGDIESSSRHFRDHPRRYSAVRRAKHTGFVAHGYELIGDARAGECRHQTNASGSFVARLECVRWGFASFRLLGIHKRIRPTCSALGDFNRNRRTTLASARKSHFRSLSDFR